MMYSNGNENIPFVNSNLLFQELSKIGENLWKKLLSDTGNEKDISSIIASSSASNPISESKIRQRLLNWMDLPPTVNPDGSKPTVNSKIGIVPIFVIRYSSAHTFGNFLAYFISRTAICIIIIDSTVTKQWSIPMHRLSHCLISKTS